MTQELFSLDAVSPLFFEEQARKNGFSRIVGVDEAGRGPLAGPVVAAAVILPPQFELPGLNDSKKLSAKKREALFPLIRTQALAVGVGIVSSAVIDEINILQASLRAMSLAVTRLRTQADYALVDGIFAIPLALPQQTLKQGDSRSLSISAASIIAKVIRDRLMVAYDLRYPGYGLAKHKGYGTAEHLAAIARLGPSPLHRKTFAGVREHLERI